MDLRELVQVLYFFGPAYAADMSPVLAGRLLPAWSLPIDGGLALRGKPILGSHKTWRGLVAGVIVGTVAFEVQKFVDSAGLLRDFALIDYQSAGLLPGLLMGLGAGAGDSLKSFFKRRIGIRPGATWLVFDQLDFFAGAYAFVSLVYVPPGAATLAVIPIIFLCEIAATALFYQLGLKDSWI